MLIRADELKQKNKDLETELIDCQERLNEKEQSRITDIPVTDIVDSHADLAYF